MSTLRGGLVWGPLSAAGQCGTETFKFLFESRFKMAEKVNVAVRIIRVTTLLDSCNHGMCQINGVDFLCKIFWTIIHLKRLNGSIGTSSSGHKSTFLTCSAPWVFSYTAM